VGETISLGRIAGIRVGLNWSMLLIFWLVAVTLANEVFPRDVPGYGAGTYWAMAVVAATLFYASLLAHELGHAIVARRRGVEVEGITLWLFGGVARLHGEAHSAGAEARIAVVGPLISIAVAVIFAGAAGVLNAAGVSPVVWEVSQWLAAMNLLLGIFNLIPAFPLDGGRVLRAILWGRRGDRVSATTTAAQAGRLFGYFLIAMGLLQFFAVAAIGGLWFVFLGWFLVSAARAEETQVQLRSALAGVRVADVMTADPVVAPGWITVEELVNSYILAQRHTVYPVRDFDGRIEGLVTLNRLRTVPAEMRRATRVKDVACPLSQVPTAHPWDPLLDLLENLERGCSDGRGLIFDGQGKLVGIVSPSDVARTIALARLRSHPVLAG
jgi:Zn-dependent protease/CBS domain-containing protein